MITVAHLITSLSTGGAEMMLHQLLTSMDRSRFRNIAISVTDQGTLGPILRDQGLPVYSLGMRRGVPSPRGLWRLVRLLRRERPSVLQTWLYHSDLLGLVVKPVVGGPRLVWNIRCSDTDDRYTKGLAGLVVKSLSLFSSSPDAVVVNSIKGQDVHQRLGYHPRRWEMIPNGIDLDRFQPDPDARSSVREELGIGAEDLVIGLIARFDPLKGHDTFLQAAALHHEVSRSTRFVLVGSEVDDKNSELVAKCRELGIDGNVHLLGERSDIPRLAAALDIATCSSLGEGFPTFVAEAMACGIPCVTTDVGDARPLVADTGVVVPPDDPPALAAGWRELMDAGADARRMMGQRARRRISENYELGAVAKRYERLYEELSRTRTA